VLAEVNAEMIFMELGGDDLAVFSRLLVQLICAGDVVGLSTERVVGRRGKGFLFSRGWVE